METKRVQLVVKGELNWPHILEFYKYRMIDGLEKIGTNSYSRHVRVLDKEAWFEVQFDSSSNGLLLYVEFEDVSIFDPLVESVRRMLDLDADTRVIDKHLEAHAPDLVKHRGIRIPGVWNTWEAGVRAIIGQQVSVKAAIGQLNRLVQNFSKDQNVISFPTPSDLANADLSFLKMPQSRKDTLKRFAEFILNSPDSDPHEWLTIKGIGPWTVNYALLRGLSLPDRFLDTDLIVKKRMASYPKLTKVTASPWGSYATFHLWNQ